MQMRWVKKEEERGGVMEVKEGREPTMFGHTEC